MSRETDFWSRHAAKFSVEVKPLRAHNHVDTFTRTQAGLVVIVCDRCGLSYDMPKVIRSSLYKCPACRNSKWNIRPSPSPGVVEND